MEIYIILFGLGLIAGSFINVVVYRETQPETIKKTVKKHSALTNYVPTWVMGRSYCDYCKHKLSWYDNIPLLSFLLLQGKCRYCHKSIPRSYPIFEFITALEFVWVYWLIQRFSFFQQMEGVFSLGVLGFWIFVFTLSLVLSVIDMKRGILPDSLIVVGIFAAILRLFFTGRWEFLIGGAGLCLFFLALYLLTQGKGIGFGDVKLSFFIGVVLGWWQWILLAMFFAFLTGAVVGVILIVLGKKSMKSTIPFGPFLLGGMIVVKVFGDFILQWYSQGY